MAYRQSIVKIPFTGAGSIIKDRALVMPGVTQGSNLGLAIVATGAAADALGFLKGDSVVANDSVQAGTTWTYKEVELKDAIEMEEWEYSQASADLVSVASTSGTTVTITSDENNADCGWLYAVSGTGAGLLAFATAQTSGTATTKTATGWDSTTKVIKIQRFGHKLLTLNSAGTKIKSQAAAGSWTVFVWELYFQALGFPKVLLDPTKHDNLTLSGARFFTRISLRSNAGR